jgi:hypothetical protein
LSDTGGSRSEVDSIVRSRKVLLGRVNKAIDVSSSDRLSGAEKKSAKNTIAAVVRSKNKKLSTRFVTSVQGKKWDEVKIMVSVEPA